MTPRYLYPSDVTHRTAPRLLILAAGILAGALLGAAPAAAHTTLKQSDPAAGSTVQKLPEVVRLTFSDTLPIVPTVTVRDDAGTVVNSSPISPRGNTVLQPVKSTKIGKFTVTWELTSADGHKTSGSFAFTVATAPSGAPSPTAPVEVTATPKPEAPHVVVRGPIGGLVHGRRGAGRRRIGHRRRLAALDGRHRRPARRRRHGRPAQPAAGGASTVSVRWSPLPARGRGDRSA